MDRKHGAATSLAAISCAVALAGCGAADHRPHAQPGPLAVMADPEIVAGAPAGAAPARPTRRGSATPPAPPTRRAGATPPARPTRRARPTWLINPDAPLPRNSPWWPVLAVARRFAVADMSYEIGELGPAVRQTIATTCTTRFAAGLFAQRASLPPGVRPRQVSQRLVGVEPLERLPGSAVVLATLRSNGHGGAPGAFELRLVPRAGGWRVAGLTVV
jgi:hypothetical protein